MTTDASDWAYWLGADGSDTVEDLETIAAGHRDRRMLPRYTHQRLSFHRMDGFT